MDSPGGAVSFFSCLLLYLLCTAPRLLVADTPAFADTLAFADTPALFVFGDSLVDAGNNNYLQTLTKANYPPFGFNFDTGKPTGRFTDGRLITDFIASYLGLPLPRPHLALGNVQHGASFASGGSGLTNITGTILPLWKQVEDFQIARDDMQTALGKHNATELIAKSIYYISSGNNDFANNYFLSTELQKVYTVSEFADYLVSIIHQQMKVLYNLGARKFVVTSVTALGCNPTSLYNYKIDDPGECAPDLDNAAKLFNTKLQDQLKQPFGQAHVLYANLYGVMDSIVKDGRANGFPNVDEPCCPFGSEYINCYPFASTCLNASKHVFWDLLHPTGAFNQVAARRFWNGDSSHITPMNIQQLAAS